MSFKSQLSKSISSINHKIWLLKNFREHMDVNTATLILKAMLLPFIDYNSVFFSGRNNEQKKIQILQNIAIRICLKIKDPMSISVKDIHTNVNVLSVDLRREYLQGILCYRLIKLNSLKIVHNRVTRAADGPLIQMYLCHTRRVQLSPAVSAYNVWNKLKPDLRNSETTIVFKNSLKKKIKLFFENEWRYDLQFTNLNP